MKSIASTLLVLLAFIILPCCEEAPEDLFTRHFVTEKGEHYSTPRLAEMLQSQRLIFTARFDGTAIYDLGDLALQSNKNKLLGFSDCNSMHHDNSARFAWQWFNERLEIYAYCYVDGNRVEEYIGTVGINEVNRYEIEITADYYVFYINGENIVQIRRSDKVCSKGVYYMLYPYFGGSVPAPHDIQIDLAIVR
jgi:hypothetical protein